MTKTLSAVSKTATTTNSNQVKRYIGSIADNNVHCSKRRREGRAVRLGVALKCLGEIVYLVVALGFFRTFFSGFGFAGFRRDWLAFALGRERANRLVSNDFGNGAIDHSLALVFKRLADKLLRVVFLRQPGTQLGCVSGRQCADFVRRGEHFREQALLLGGLRLALRCESLEQQVTRLFELQNIFPAALECSIAHLRCQLIEFRIHVYRFYGLAPLA